MPRPNRPDPVAQVLTFEQAVAEATAGGANINVLLGNGFSIACRPDCFSYGSLLEEANFDDAHGQIRFVFAALKTSDFERVIRELGSAAQLVKAYDRTLSLADELDHDVAVVRQALAVAIAQRHPDRFSDVAPEEYASARMFLANFARIYTLNYDMLLYWTAMQEMQPAFPRNDGFGMPDDPDAPYVAWEPYIDFHNQRIYFVHGGLHLYDRGDEIAKITWSRTGIALVDQIREALEVGDFPLIVTEGSTEEKATKILHSAYLNHAIRSLAQTSNPLFVYGHSLDRNDDHVLRRISRGKVTQLYVSLYGPADDGANQRVIARARAIAGDRRSGPPLKVQFFDAESAMVWNRRVFK